MDRLTETVKYPLDNFQRCQLCGFTSSDICEFRMLMECDNNDVPEQDKILVRCRQESCVKVVEDHPRLYAEVPIVQWAGIKANYINDWYGGKGNNPWVKHKRDAKLFESVKEAELEVKSHYCGWEFQVLFIHPLNMPG